MDVYDINSDIIKHVNKKEIYRYLGYRNNEPDHKIEGMVSELLNELVKVSVPKSMYRVYDCEVTNNEVKLFGCEDKLLCLAFNSKNLADNLRQCSRVVLLAATIGIGADKLLNKYELMNMTKASVIQACAAAYIEAFCDFLQDEIRKQALDEGLYLRPRFSPGYGDLKLETQKHIFEVLECTKRIGLTLTQSLLMYPTKSVTAFIGLTPNKQSCHIDKCKQCNNIGCEFRNE